jgi:cytochrome d ubiquinol oxidase subunit II
VIGAVASGRVPVGNAAGDLVTSWLNPTAMVIGALALATSGYLAAVYLAADARRSHEPALARAFRARALAMGVVAGVIAVAGLVVLRADSRALFDDLTSGAALAAVLVSAAAGLATLALVWAERHEAARVSAALAVAAIVAGWGLAQRPDLLPGLTVEQAAADHATLVAVLVTVAAGLVVLVPSLVLLFGLVLHGRFDAAGPAVRARPPVRAARVPSHLVVIGLAVAGVPLTLFGEGALVAVGVLALAAFVAAGALELLRPQMLDEGEPGR